jgi:outer membrane protein OmpA-like peptidoglycan-associated protein
VTSLQKLGELLRRNPQARFRIEGYTDSFGGLEYNAKLSLARAESVKSWLAQNMGIDPARIDTRGLGSAKPLVSTEGSIEEQQLNRRVEIVILRGDGGR